MAVRERLDGVALVADRNGVFRLEEVVTAPIGENEVGVKTLWSGVSIGTEFAVLTGNLNWGTFPIVTGYMATGVVSVVGSEVSGVSVGDTVYYRRNAGLELRATGVALNCRSGTHASVAVLDPSGTHGAELVPSGVDSDVASLFVMPSVGLYGVDMGGVGVGATVVVIGLGMIGLGVVAAAVRRGAVVVGVDPRAECRALAVVFGAKATFHSSDEGASHGILDALATEQGADFVFESTGKAECIDGAIRLCRPFGCFVWQGNYGEGTVGFEFLQAHHRRLRMVFPCDDGYRPFRRASLEAIASGAMPWGNVITHRVDAQDVAVFYEGIFKGKASGVVGAVVDWRTV